MTRRANEQMPAAELWILHAPGVLLEVIRFQANLLNHFGMGGVERASGGHRFLDFALVEQTLLMHLPPGFPRGLVIGVEFARQLPQVLAGVIEIGDLDGARENATGPGATLTRSRSTLTIRSWHTSSF
jgi:hypothetical protein